MESAKITGEKTIEIYDKSYECWVVKARYKTISQPAGPPDDDSARCASDLDLENDGIDAARTHQAERRGEACSDDQWSVARCRSTELEMWLLYGVGAKSERSLRFALAKQRIVAAPK